MNTEVKSERPMKPLYQVLAGLVGAYHRCKAKGGDAVWGANHGARIRELVREHMPSGSGFDNATGLWLNDSTEEKLVFGCSFHHMNDGGFYDGWTNHKVTVKASLFYGITLAIGGRNRNDIKDHIHESFDVALRTMVED